MYKKYLRVVFLFAMTTSIALADEIKYQAVWHQGQAASFITAPLTLSVFKSSGQALAESGKRLLDVETTTRNGIRLYAGLWSQGTGTNLFVGPVGTAEFGNERRAKFEQGLRLEDFEVFRNSAGGRRYLGVWKNGSGKEVLTGPMEKDAFLARGERLTADGLRLVDVEVERVGGRLLYHGLFKTGTGSNFITPPKRLRAFARTRDEMVSNGLELIDVEHVKIGAVNRFIGVWASGEGNSKFSKLRPYGKFFSFVHSQQTAGRGSRDFELRRIPTLPTPPGPGGGGGTATADLPDLPAWMELTSSLRLQLEWGIPNSDAADDNEIRLTLPISALPEYLPTKEGEPVIPDAFCGMNVSQVQSISWQVGEEILVDFPFNHVPDLAAIEFDPEFGNQNFLQAGIEFSGPIGGCEGSGQGWDFPIPITQGDPSTSLNNIKLVIELMPGAEIRFIDFQPPEAEFLHPHELFSDEVFSGMIEMAEQFVNTQIDNGYCESVSNYMTEVCDTTPGLCPVEDPVGSC